MTKDYFQDPRFDRYFVLLSDAFCEALEVIDKHNLVGELNRERLEEVIMLGKGIKDD